MKINSPGIITPRLLPGVEIGGACISIEYDEWTNDGRMRYRYYIDPGLPEEGEAELCSGTGGGSLQSGLESLLGFLGAFGDAWDYYPDGAGENCDLFPKSLAGWAIENYEEIGLLAYDLEESGTIIFDEDN